MENDIILSIDIAQDSPHWREDENFWHSFFQKIGALVLRHTPHSITAKSISFSVLLTDDPHMQQLNAQYRGKDKPTNVLSFPPHSHVLNNEDTYFLGDVAFGWETITQEAKEGGKTWLDHMTHLTIHGLLHLLGYDHEMAEEAEIMENHEIHLLKMLSISNPYQEDA